VIVEMLVSGDEESLSREERATLYPQRIYRALFTPTDPHWPLQWNATVMNMPAAWDTGVTPPFDGESSVVIAIPDTGIAYATSGGHVVAPDLSSMHLWVNSAETVDGIDNDGNGYIDDINGWNFIADTNAPLDDYGHGTHIASTIAGGINNGQATAGIAPGVTIMPLKVLDNTGIGTTASITNAIRYAVAQGADIINLSLGGTDPDVLLENAINEATAAGVLVVSAAGNDGDDSLNFPARYSGVISVGATQYDATRAPYANYGTGLTVVAPGGNTSLDQNRDGQPDGIPAQTCQDATCSTFATFFLTGTSQATAHVSGVLGLLLSCVPNPSSARSALTTTATDLGSAGYDTVYGAGLINAQQSLATLGCVSETPSSPANVRILSSTTSTTTLSSTRAWPYTRPAIRWTAVDGTTYTVTWRRTGTADTVVTQSGSTFSLNLTKAGTYIVSVKATDSHGRSSPVVTTTYRYRPGVMVVGSTTQAITYSGTGVRGRTYAGVASLTSGTGSSVNIDAGDRIFVTDSQRGATVRVLNADGKLTQTLQPFGKNYTGGLSAAIVHQVNQAATIVVSSTTIGEVRWLNANGGVTSRKVSNRDRGYTVATGDLNGDGNDEVIVADRQGSKIRIYSATGTLLATTEPLGSGYRAGWVMSAGDVTGDGKDEIQALPANARKNPPVFLLNIRGANMKTLRLNGLTSTQSFLMTTVNTDGAKRDRILVSTGQSVVTAWNDQAQKIKTYTLSHRVTSLGSWHK